MAPQDSTTRLRETLGRKLSKRIPTPRRISMDLPERFRDGSDDENDVCAPRHGGVALNQSIFGLIAAAGSAAGLDEIPSDSEEEESAKSPMSQTMPALIPTPAAGGLDGTLHIDPSKHRRRSSKALLVKSLHKLRLKPIRERKRSTSAEDMMSSSQILQPRQPDSEAEEEQEEDSLPNAPYLSRILTADKKMREELTGQTSSQDRPQSPAKQPSSLAETVQTIFKFDEKQDIIAEYRCNLVQNINVPGYIFVTKRYICFYAYLPQMTARFSKTGYISKRGTHDPRYRRFYCELKAHVLNFYQEPTQVNYPSTLIDMRRAIGVFATGDQKGKDDTYFTLETDKREYHLRADSAASASDWIKVLQQELLNTHNDGGLVKITLPIENILDIEDNYIRGMAFSESLRIRVIDNDESYAVDEFYFTFEKHGYEAIRVLKLIVQGGDDNDDSELSGSEGPGSSRNSLNVERPSAVPARTPPLRDSVRSTLVPQPPGARIPSGSRLSSDSRRSSLEVRPSMEHRRRSYDDGRRSVSIGRRFNKSPMSPHPQESVESPTTTSADPDTESSAAIQSLDESADGTHASDSQILNRNDVFQVPTIHAPSPQRARTDTVDVDRLHRASQDTARRQTGSPPRERQVKSKRPAAVTRISTSGLSHSEQDAAKLEGSSYSIGRLVGAGMSPLQSASGLAGRLSKQAKTFLPSTAPMDVYEKVAGMWQGGGRHYGAVPGSRPEDHVLDEKDEERAQKDAWSFRDHFAMPDSENLIASWHCYQQRTLPIYGKLYLGSTHLCWRPFLGKAAPKMKLRLKIVETVVKGTSYRLGYAGMCVVVSGDAEVFFDFKDQDLRDDCAVSIIRAVNDIDPSVKIAESGLLSPDEIKATEVAKAEHKAMIQARHAEKTGEDGEEADFLAESMLFEDPAASIHKARPAQSLRITCLTIGSRGDVQPYIALCKGLLKEGHRPRIATHAEFGDWIKKHGIDFEPIDGDPAVLMQLCVENGMFTFSFMKEATLHFRSWIEGLMSTAWKACQESDVIIESPSAMVGIHIAEALQVPYFRAFGMPWTRTRAFPHAFFVPNNKSGGTYNYMTYTLFDNLFWKSTSGQMNNWRKRELGLGPTSLSKMGVNKVPFLYNFSKFVVRQPLDWSEWVRITGFWFLDEEDGWTPPDELTNFIKKARSDGKKLVYIGFGSITVDNPAALTETVVRAVVDNDLRCVLSKGWSDRMVKPKLEATAEVKLPPEILQIKYSVPHSWLFPQMDAITHHGGAGTTGASLRAGKPTIIKPFFGDQYFYGSRVEDLGVGIYVRIMNEKKFGRALYLATHDERMLKKAKFIGEQIRSEDGVATAIDAIYRDLDYARSLIEAKTMKPDALGKDGSMDVVPDMEEEQWTFVDDSDPETKKMQQSMHWNAELGRLVIGPEALEELEHAEEKGKEKSKAKMPS